MTSSIRPPTDALSLLDALASYACPWRDFADAFEGEVFDSQRVQHRLYGLCGIRRFYPTAPFPAPTDQELWLAAIADLLMQLAQGRLHAWAIEDPVRAGWVEIQPNIWALIDVEEIDWYLGRVSLPGQTLYDVKVAPAAAVPPLAPSPPLAPEAGGRKGGRRHTYDWQAFEQEAIRVLEEEGLPTRPNEKGWRCQADLERCLVAWCEDSWGEENVPAESMIRKHIKDAIKEYKRGREGR